MFPAGKEKRNFLAASRDGAGHFKGIIDRVVVYHGVHEDFAEVPEPTRDAPRRVWQELIASLEKQYGNLDAIKRKHRALFTERMKFFDALKATVEQRLTALKERSPAFVEAGAKLEAVKGELADRRRISRFSTPIACC